MATATLVTDNLAGWAPGTRQYSTDDGKFLAVEAAPIPKGEQVENTSVDGVVVKLDEGRQSVKFVALPAVIFLCGEDGEPIDADENDYDPLTPLHTFPAGTSHEDALTQAGYTL